MGGWTEGDGDLMKHVERRGEGQGNIQEMGIKIKTGSECALRLVTKEKSGSRKNVNLKSIWWNHFFSIQHKNAPVHGYETIIMGGVKIIIGVLRKLRIFSS